MNARFSIVLSFIVSFFYSALNAQFLGEIAANRFIYKVSSNKNYNFGQSGSEIVGSPYLQDEFIKGEVCIDKGKYGAIPLRYNIYDDKIEFLQNDIAYTLDPDVRIRRVIIGNCIFVVDKFEYKWKMQTGYLVLLDSGKITLMSKKVVSFKDRQEPRAMETAATPAKFSRLSDVFYFKIGNSELTKIESIKDMIASIPEKNEELSQFAKKEKISPKKEEELIKLVRYYNSL